ncbi:MULTISPECIES: hypothetical protein [Maribacter]|nr:MULTISPECIES: hypothetical protein [Maribacter]MBU2902856.1 hypothetical protein [Maribacter dokdonensis]HAF79009.1 hypothetical protein [Maribacter sp.]|tara:strand:+ start:5930 stop:7021 length:1092 start_codon:yes stop_codon:yes gene_type:complete
MKTLLYKYTWLLFLAFSTVAFANDTSFDGKHTKEKTIKKEFNVSTNALLKIDNSYGNLNITSWNENRVVIEVHIKTNGNNEDKVQKKLDEISVDFEANNERVYAKTIFNKNNNGWGWSWGNNNNVNMQINYTIKVPVKNNVDLSNDYGNIILDRIDGHAKINCDYGRLELGELRGRNNRLNFDYTSKSTIGFINSGEIRADYSGFTIEKAGDLHINADYTNASIGKMGNLDYTSDYGNMDIEELQSIDGNGDYITVKLGVVHGDVSITADYGSIRIDELAADAGDVEIRTDYTGVKIGYNSAYHFDFDISTSYAGVSGKDDFTINISIEKSSDKHYEGFYGAKGSGNKIILTSDYGGISFSKK